MCMSSLVPWRIQMTQLCICPDYYYYATAGGAKIWACFFFLRKILQFLICIVVEEVPDNNADFAVHHRPCTCILWQYVLDFLSSNCYSCLKAYSHTAAAYYPHLPHVGNCSGSEGAAFFGCALLTSYLGLFINFYMQTYKRPATLTNSNGVT